MLEASRNRTAIWRRIASATAQMFASRMLGQAAGLLTTVIVARYLGPEAFGLYAFALAATVVLAQFPGPGLDMAATRLSTPAWNTKPASARGTLVIAVLVRLAVGFALTVVGLVVTWPTIWPAIATHELTMPLRYALFAAFALALSEVMTAVLQCRERFAAILYGNLLLAGLRVVPIVALVLLGALGLVGTLVVFVAASILGAMVMAVLARDILAGPRRCDGAALRALLRQSCWLVPNMMLGTVTVALDVVLVTYLLGPQAAGVYSAGRALAIPFALISTALGAVLLPKLSLLNRVEMGSFIREVNQMVGPSVAVVSAVTLACAPLAVKLVYGPSYAGATIVLQFLTLAYLAQVLAWPHLTVLIVCDRSDLILGLSVLMFVATALGMVVVLPHFGVAGAAAVMCVNSVLMIIPYWLIARHLTRGDVLGHLVVGESFER